MVEFEHPHILLEDCSSMFHQMVQDSGDVSYKTLCEQALTSLSAHKHLEIGEYMGRRNFDILCFREYPIIIGVLKYVHLLW